MRTAPDHARWEDSAGAYALGALADAERAGFEAHLEACEACRAELDELLVAAEALPAAAPPMVPPPALKARLMAEVEREAALLAAAGPQADRPVPPPRARRRSWREWFGVPAGAVAALACAALVVGLGAGGVLFGGGEGMHKVPFAPSGAAASAKVELEVRDDGATLVARNLPAPRNGRVYQVWLMRRGKKAPEPTSTLFTPRSDGSATASVPGKLSDVDAVLVTSEPPGGSDAPSESPLLQAKMT